jgi:hypothetical protein
MGCFYSSDCYDVSSSIHGTLFFGLPGRKIFSEPEVKKTQFGEHLRSDCQEGNQKGTLMDGPTIAATLTAVEFAQSQPITVKNSAFKHALKL